MADTLYLDLGALHNFLQALVGPRVNLSNGGPERVDGFADVNDLGVPLATMDPDDVKGLPALKVTWSILGWVARGQDDLVREFDEDTDKLTTTVKGLRHFTLSIQAESDAVTCHSVIERLRLMFNSPSVLDGLRALGIAIRDVSDTRAIKVPDRDRQTYDASLVEIRCSFGTEMVDTEVGAGEAAGAYIASVVPLTWDGD
jgi:hypothetical protein